MIYRVSHQTNYTYSEPVFLEPHTFRLTPRTDVSQKISDFTFTAKPQPAGLHHFLDSENNNATCLWFEEKTASLAITTSFVAETLCPNPFGYLVTDSDFLKLPVTYKYPDATILTPYLTVHDPSDTLISYGRSILAKSNAATPDFLSLLCQEIYQNFRMEIREQGVPLEPALTLRQKRGACRDLVMLYLAVCRNFGLAARFVSGYQEGDPDMEQQQLHAWAEVYIPGGGWRGYDPSHGLVVADRHIALAASFDSVGTMPVMGNFRGTGTSAAMTYNISLSAL